MSRAKPFPINTSVGKWLKVTKVDAAEAQLNTAIALYFQTDDPVSVQTLCFAASEILERLLLAKGKRGIYRADNFLPEYQDAYLATIKEPSNFFKHAGSDPNASLDFLPALNDLQLALACHGYYELTGRLTPQMIVLMLWTAIHHPESFHFAEQQSLRPQIEQLRKNASSLKRDVFYTATLRTFSDALKRDA